MDNIRQKAEQDLKQTICIIPIVILHQAAVVNMI